MSMPNIPDINSSITVTRDNGINIILSSIGMEELALSHFINAEAEKVQYVVGTLHSEDELKENGKFKATNHAAERKLKEIIASKKAN